MAVIVPLNLIGSILAQRLQNSMIKDSDGADKEADLLCGDSIVNYKTVQSFGHEDAIIDMYEKILAPNLIKQKKVAFRTGIALGINIFI